MVLRFTFRCNLTTFAPCQKNRIFPIKKYRIHLRTHSPQSSRKNSKISNMFISRKRQELSLGSNKNFLHAKMYNAFECLWCSILMQRTKNTKCADSAGRTKGPIWGSFCPSKQFSTEEFSRRFHRSLFLFHLSNYGHSTSYLCETQEKNS